jgi:peptide/nickel transport system substrate-binding protein
LDDYTVRVAFKAPSPTIERDFAAHYSYSGYILPKKYIEEKGEDYFSAHPIGSGPYQISDIKQDVSITFKAVPNHWRIQPDFETLILRNVPDNSTRVAMLKGGQVDLIQLSFDNLEELSANPKVHFLRIPFERMSTIIIQGAWQDDGEAVQNLKVRQALDYAINREEISKEFFSGYAKPEKYWKVSEAGEIWDTAWDNEATPYDPQKARELLAEAGYPDAFKYPAVRVYTQTERAYQVKLTELIASYWEAVGIKVEIFVNDVVTTGNVLYGNPELPRDSYGAVFVWTSPVGLNDGILNASQKTFYVTTGIASASRVDKEIDEWYRLGERELDVKTRNEYDLKILKRVHDENKYFLGLNYIDTIWAASNKVAGWDADRRPGSFAATYPSIKKNEQ